MTKREYLESRGYKYLTFGRYYNKTTIIGYYSFVFSQIINLEENKFFIKVEHGIQTQKDIDNLQIAFNDLKRDFKEMMKYE